MDKVLIVLSVFGCGDAAVNCDLLGERMETYQTEAACERRVEDVLTTATGLPYPMVVAQCANPAETAATIAELVPGQPAAEEMIAMNVEDGS